MPQSEPSAPPNTLDPPPPYSSFPAFVDIEYPHGYWNDSEDDQAPRFSWINDKECPLAPEPMPSLFAWSDTTKSDNVSEEALEPSLAPIPYPWPDINSVPVAYDGSEEVLFRNFSWPISSSTSSTCSSSSIITAIRDGDENDPQDSSPFSMSAIIDNIDDTIEELYSNDLSQLRDSPSPFQEQNMHTPLSRLRRTLPHPVPLSMPTAPSPPPSTPAPFEFAGRVLRRRLSPRRESLRELRSKDSDACLQRAVEDRLSMYLDGSIFGIRVEKEDSKRKKEFRLRHNFGRNFRVDPDTKH